VTVTQKQQGPAPGALTLGASVPGWPGGRAGLVTVPVVNGFAVGQGVRSMLDQISFCDYHKKTRPGT
jgi:hypothetical protein